MRKLFTLFYLAATVVIARAEDKTHVSGVIEGKLLRLAPELQQKLAENSIKLLSSCSYSSLHDSNTNKLHFEDAEKHSHLTIIFPKPQMVEVPLEKVNVKVKEMVITLPLSSGGIWVRSDGSTSYFAMFTPDTYFKWEALLKAAQKQ